MGGVSSRIRGPARMWAEGTPATDVGRGRRTRRRLAALRDFIDALRESSVKWRHQTLQSTLIDRFLPENGELNASARWVAAWVFPGLTSDSDTRTVRPGRGVGCGRRSRGGAPGRPVGWSARNRLQARQSLESAAEPSSPRPSGWPSRVVIPGRLTRRRGTVMSRTCRVRATVSRSTGPGWPRVAVEPMRL